MFTEAESDFQEARVRLLVQLNLEYRQRQHLSDGAQEFKELEAHHIIQGPNGEGLEGKNEPARQAQLVQLLKADPAIVECRKKQAGYQAKREQAVVDIERHKLALSSARARRQFATTLLAYYATAQDDRMAMTPEGAATVGAEA